jgi:hypothetical protein
LFPKPQPVSLRVRRAENKRNRAEMKPHFSATAALEMVSSFYRGERL